MFMKTDWPDFFCLSNPFLSPVPEDEIDIPYALTSQQEEIPASSLLFLPECVKKTYSAVNITEDRFPIVLFSQIK